MSDTQNKWIPVSERLPDKVQEKLVRTNEQEFRLAYVLNGKWRDADVCEDLEGVTHWMDLPEPPKTPNPAGPFEAWWDQCCNTVSCSPHDARIAWNAAKEHYAKPLPDFETWWFGLESFAGTGIAKLKGSTVARECALSIWNAAQGKPEAQWVNTPNQA